MRQCTDCGESKPESEFRFRSRAKGIRHSQCKRCNGDQIRDARYRLPAGWYRQTYEQQLGRCAVCDQPQPVLHVDHDHSCCPQRQACPNCVRGLICNRCNLGLAYFHDEVALFRAAASYLERAA